MTIAVKKQPPQLKSLTRKRPTRVAPKIAKPEQAAFVNLDMLVSNLRWLWLLVAATFVIGESMLSIESNPNLTLLLTFIAIGGLLNGLYAALLWFRSFPQWLGIAALIGDAALAIVLLGLSNQHIHLQLPIMLFPVIMAGVRWNIEAGLGMAMSITFSYALTFLLTFGFSFTQPGAINTLLIFGVNALTLFGAGMLPGPLVGHRIQLVEHQKNEEVRRFQLASERGELISEMVRLLGSTLDYQKVLQTVIHFGSAAVRSESKKETIAGMVLLFSEEQDGNNDRLSIVASENIGRLDLRRRVDRTIGIIGRVFDTAEAVISHDLKSDKTLVRFKSLVHHRSVICLPLRSGYNTYGVVLLASTKPQHFDETHQTLLTTLCSQASIALQNTLLFDELQQEQQKLLEKEVEARHKLARDLHDGPTQGVAVIAMRMNFIKMLLEHKEYGRAQQELAEMEGLANKTSNQMRTTLFALRPILLETQGLVPALEGYAERLNANEAFTVTVSNQGYIGQLHTEAEDAIFAIIEEAIGNAKKHAQATKITIALRVQDTSVSVAIRDNGVGFDVAATKSTYDQRSSLGLINLDERARLLGGRCSIYSTVGRGTSVQIEIPIVAAQAVG